MTTAPTLRAAGDLPATGPDGSWWAPALALHERIHGIGQLRDSADEVACARFDRWRGRYGPQGEAAFQRRLADLGIDQAVVLRLLGEPPAVLAARAERPRWARAVEEALRSAVPPAADVPVPTRWEDAFAWSVQPLVTATVRQLARRLPPHRFVSWLDVPAVLAGFGADLGHRLVTMAAPTFVAQLHAWRDAGRLRGRDSRQRFVDFVRMLSETSGLWELFTDYPVLARLLAETSRSELDALTRLLSRFADDRDGIVRVVLGGVDPGPLCGISAGLGDPHQRGEGVRLLHFTGGTRIVYKPRGVQAQVHLGGMVRWLSTTVPGLDLRTPAVLAVSGHGWQEFVGHQPVTGTEAASAYYRRLGALLVLLHVTHTTDMHCENVVAAGDQPLVIDAETLFHPYLSTIDRNDDPALLALATSVIRTGMLPCAGFGGFGGTDTSALAGATGAPVVRWEAAGTDQMRVAARVMHWGAGHSRPHLDGKPTDPGDYLSELLHGFRLAYDAVRRNRDRLAAMVGRCTDFDVRVVARPTRRYRAMLDEAGRPEALRDGMDRDQAFDPLWIEANDPVRRALATHEAIDLWAGDIPLVTARPGDRDLWTSNSIRLPRLLDRPVGDRAKDMLSRLGDVDRRDQEWILTASLATRVPLPAHRCSGRSLARMDGIAAPPQRLLAAACEIAARLVATGISDGDRINWLGLEPVDGQRWLLLPTGAGLADGNLGIALFLAEVARLSGVPRFAAAARHAIRGYPQLCQLLKQQPELAAAIGCGGLSGLGGMAYGLSRLGMLLRDAEIAALAADTVGLTAHAVERSSIDWRDGTAGCLAAMLAVHRDLGLPSAGRLAHRCFDLLAPVVSGAEPDALPNSFATGWVGVSLALHRMAGAFPRCRPLAARAVALLSAAPAPVPGEPGLCAGDAGRLLGAVVGAVSSSDAEQGVQAAASRPLLRDLSLCHGELSVTEALTALAGTGRHPGAVQVRRRRASLVLDAIRRHGPICSTPEEVETPGLLTGLAGIGYGLLRLGFHRQVPSVLLLESPSSAGPW
ncbi:type 2 lanthipeptide synthetase LanM family protein [Micromonospora carbonacea]|uniref:Type 2 lantipeptide synthetase LanM n=1 Tax=Micromonospora carbonacea TaxID=47853 RepID=A0A7H8XLV4_9ACTN|nr:type 2 lanthipeptide synthetase LanM family protein [Micromonospora carbonacea]MBB5825958.1 type 2 lantibiotic biosynthesis protein LanM [Micromonospora carbonacea]QLD25548.1 type 2 lantipeptide synthetase LanM [Micromonospora carbonacea]